MNYYKTAKRAWRKSAWIHGDGSFAVVAFCNVTTVSLHAEREDADASKDFIDRLGCGHQCYRHHKVVDLTDLGATA